MRVHFIAIGGSAMHNLAMALHDKGYKVSGSDDEIFEPSRTRLEQRGLLPDRIGWNPSLLTTDIDAVILGMHARKDNPELARAKELGLKVYSYPEFLFEQSKDKKRVVIGGSHGKTTITSMILHVCKLLGVEVDYMVGAQLQGFDCMVKLSNSAPIVILEGDEYLSSPDDLRPKFHLYHPHVAVLSGIAWDHINVFPTFDNYVDQFRQFIRLIEPGGVLHYCHNDEQLESLAAETINTEIEQKAYTTHPNRVEKGQTYLLTDSGEVPINVFGEHNLQNLSAARAVCRSLGISNDNFYRAISSFNGASKRLEKVKETAESVFYKDFAHSPSKLKASTEALKNQFPDRKLIACMELHTFSSLNKTFLDQYHGCMAAADEALVYFNPKTLEHKKLPPISVEEVRNAFATNNIQVFNESAKILKALKQKNYKNANLLMMTSGNFDGIDFAHLAEEILP